MKFFFKLIILAALVYGGWWIWQNYDLAGWYKHVRAAWEIGDTQQTIVLPLKRGEQFEKQTIVYIKNNCEFSPQIVEIQKGQRVAWYNESTEEQIIYGNNFDVKILRPKKFFYLTFKEAGTFGFSCSDDQNFKGQVIVK